MSSRPSDSGVRLAPQVRDHHAFNARMKVTEVAMGLSRAGLSDDTIREIMKDIAEHAAERAIAWGHEEDRRQAAADAEDRADDWARDAAREYVSDR